MTRRASRFGAIAAPLGVAIAALGGSGCTSAVVIEGRAWRSSIVAPGIYSGPAAEEVESRLEFESTRHDPNKAAPALAGDVLLVAHYAQRMGESGPAEQTWPWRTIAVGVERDGRFPPLRLDDAAPFVPRSLSVLAPGDSIDRSVDFHLQTLWTIQASYRNVVVVLPTDGDLSRCATFTRSKRKPRPDARK